MMPCHKNTLSNRVRGPLGHAGRKCADLGAPFRGRRIVKERCRILQPLQPFVVFTVGKKGFSEKERGLTGSLGG